MTTRSRDPVWEGQLYSNGWRSAAGGTVEVSRQVQRRAHRHRGPGRRRRMWPRRRSAPPQAQREWANVSFLERAAILRRAADLIDERRDTLVAWLIRETGEIRRRAEHEVRISADEVREAAALAARPLG